VGGGALLDLVRAVAAATARSPPPPTDLVVGNEAARKACAALVERFEAQRPTGAGEHAVSALPLC
jgi:hypothetical protein